MNEAIRNLEPRELWNKFADLNAVPRPSKKEERVIAFMKEFGAKLGLETIEDEVGNVIIRKPATNGMVDRKPIVMQSHLDMVHQKNGDTVFDFDTQGIEMYVDGDWVSANGTTLGADNGLGVATIMAVLESNTIAHPAIEALFTIDEETGMTGAMGLKGGLLQGEILLNLDTEEDDEIGVGCAGGVDVTATRDYLEIDTPANSIAYVINVKGLNGGHSGMDIIKGLGNANKIMNRLLYGSKEMINLSELRGGSLRNAIPRESHAVVVVSEDNVPSFLLEIERITEQIVSEYKSVEKSLSIEVSKETGTPNTVMDPKDQFAFLNAIYATYNGVFRMSPAIDDLVETSNNIAKVTTMNGEIKVECLSRSSVKSSIDDLVNTLRAVFELADFKVTATGEYPGWAPNMNSPILEVLDALYEKINGKKSVCCCMSCRSGMWYFRSKLSRYGYDIFWAND
jgi:dipeptidase D